MRTGDLAILAVLAGASVPAWAQSAWTQSVWSWSLSGHRELSTRAYALAPEEPQPTLRSYLTVRLDTRPLARAGRQRSGPRDDATMIDLFPFRNGVRVSGGARLGADDGDVGGPSFGDVSTAPAPIGPIAEVLNAEQVAPMVTLGYAIKLRRGWSASIEGGAMFHGLARLSQLGPPGKAADGASFAAASERERLGAQGDLANYQVAPMGQLSATWHF